MQTASELLPRGRNELKSRPSDLGNKQKKPKPSDNLIDGLFNSLMGICTAWSRAWPTNDVVKAAKLAWTEELIANGVCTAEQVDVGLKKARSRGRNSAFIMPVSEFIGWCLEASPEDFDLPSVQSAYLEALKQAGMMLANHKSSFSHPAVKQAAIETDIHFLATAQESRSKPLFVFKYRRIVADIVSGKDLGSEKKKKVGLDRPDENLIQHAKLIAISEDLATDFLKDLKETAGIVLNVRDSEGNLLKFKEQSVTNSFSEIREHGSLIDLLHEEVELSVKPRPKKKGSIQYNELELKMISRFETMNPNTLKNAIDGFYASMMNDEKPEDRNQSARLMSIAKSHQEKLRQNSSKPANARTNTIRR